jgi:hypothetical protein
LHEGLTAVPGVNLVSDLSFRLEATNTKGEHRYLFSDLPAEAMTAPLRHPSRVEPCDAADAFTEEVMFSGNTHRVLARIRELHSMR